MIRPLEIKRVAKERLRGKWFDAAITYFLLIFLIAGIRVSVAVFTYIIGLLGSSMLIYNFVDTLFSALVWIFLLTPLGYGYVFYTYSIWKGESPKFDEIMVVFSKNYWKVVGLIFIVGFLMTLVMLIGFVGGYFVSYFFIFKYNHFMALSLGLFLGGIALIYLSVRLVFLKNIVFDNWESLPPVWSIIEFSFYLTKGYFWQIIKFYLSFIGWFLLFIITLLIAVLWYVPFLNVSFWELYYRMKEWKNVDIQSWLKLRSEQRDSD